MCPRDECARTTVTRVNEPADDTGLSVTALWTCSWLLGLVAAGCLIRMLTYAAGGVPVHAEFFVWVLIGAVAAAFSAGCAVLVGVKSAEQRLALSPSRR